MMKQEVKYGKISFEIDLPDDVEVILPPILALKSQNSVDLLTTALDTAELSLEDYLHRANNLLIVIPDRTRRCGLDKLLRPIIERVERSDILKGKIKILIATGTHKRLVKDDYRSFLSDYIVDNYEIIEHDFDNGNVHIGYTVRGTPVDINRLILNADRVLAIGGMLPHYFAGLGGGPKLIVPGCASRRTIETNHKMTIHPVQTYPSGCRPGNIIGNPVIEDIIECVQLLPEIYHIGILLGESEEPIKIFAGEIITTYKEMSIVAKKLFGVEEKDFAELVIASCGGYPKDIDLLQAHKSLLHASYMLKPGGTMLFFAECSEGIGSNGMEMLLKLGNYEYVKAELLKRYTMNGLAALSLLRIGNDFEVKMFTEYPLNKLNRIGFAKIPDREEAQGIIDTFAKVGKRIKFIPNAAFTVVL